MMTGPAPDIRFHPRLTGDVVDFPGGLDPKMMSMERKYSVEELFGLDKAKKRLTLQDSKWALTRQ